MSSLSEFGSKKVASVRKHEKEAVVNFMGGVSYTLSPIQTLKIVAASSIFGEPQYYNAGIKAPANIKTLMEYSIFPDLFSGSKSVVTIFEEAIDNSLDHDFKATLDLALELRTEYLMRLNPSVIFMRASMHNGRKEFNELNPGYMKGIGKKNC